MGTSAAVRGRRRDGERRGRHGEGTGKRPGGPRTDARTAVRTTDSDFHGGVSAQNGAVERTDTGVQESARYWQHPELPGVDLLRARYIRKTFVRHTHETYVIAALAEGVEAV